MAAISKAAFANNWIGFALNEYLFRSTLGDLAEIQQGKYLSPNEMVSNPSEQNPVSVVGGNKVLGYTEKSTKQRRMPLVTCRGSNCGLVQYPREPVWVSNNAMAFDTGNQEQNDFLYILLRSIDFGDIITGSAQPQITKQPLAAKEVLLPDRKYWGAISELVSSIDDKVESNRRIIPVVLRLIRAKVDQALSYGFEERPVSSLAFFVNGGAFTKGATGSGRMVLRIAELNKGPGPSTIYNDIDVPLEKLARPGDILMSWSGSLGLYRWTRAEAIVNQHIFKVLPKELPAWLVFDRVDAAMPVFQALAADRATTMGHIQRGQLDTTTVPLPSATRLEEMNEEMSSLWERLLIAEREVHLLEEIRQALLPELLSGRIRVGELSE